MTDAAGGDDLARATSGRRSIPRVPAIGSALNLIGPLLVALPCILAGVLGFATYAPYGSDAAIGIAVGAAAVVAMSQTLILAARPRLLEPLFGGLDRMYRVHKWLGISALVVMILHDTLEPDFERTVRETGLGELASEAGEIAFNALLALIAISWFRRLPFRTSEEAIGVETLQAAAARNPRFSFEVVATASYGRLTAERLIGSAPFPFRKADLWFCGPTGLKDGIIEGLRTLAQTPRHMRFEHFEFA